MGINIEWVGGISIQYGGTHLFFDTRRRNSPGSTIFVTHAHLDHSNSFPSKYSKKLSTEPTRQLFEVYGKKVEEWQPLPLNSQMVFDDISIQSHNAGHVLGSTLFEAITPEGTIVYTGDFQFADSYTLQGAKPISCDVLILDSTFGSPNFCFPSKEFVAQKLVRWATRTCNNGKIPIFKADVLGNAQEINRIFNMFTKYSVLVTSRIGQINQIYNSNGQNLDFSVMGKGFTFDPQSCPESIIIVPKNFRLSSSKAELALVSGWAIWSKHHQNAFALSDHADFNQLIEYVEACNPALVLTCFGNKSNYYLAKHIEKTLNIEARPLKLIPTKFSSSTVSSVVLSCMRQILNVLGMPGFLYSKKWILMEMRSLGFTEKEICQALDQLVQKGRLKLSVDSSNFMISKSITGFS